MHPLKRYLTEVKEPVKDFAARVGASRQTLYRIIGGAQAPKPALARRIVEATGGAVTLGAIYQRRDKRSGDIVRFRARREEALLNRERIKLAMATVVNHMNPQATAISDDMAEIAAEAVVNTYAALSIVTTRQGPDRLRQALRPVLEEILRECSDSAPPAKTLDQGADLATQLYYQSWTLDRACGPAPY